MESKLQMVKEILKEEKKLEKVKYLSLKHITQHDIAVYMQCRNFGSQHRSTLSLDWAARRTSVSKEKRGVVQLHTQAYLAESGPGSQHTQKGRLKLYSTAQGDDHGYTFHNS